MSSPMFPRCKSGLYVCDHQLIIVYSVKTAKWIGDCFIYTTANNRLCYFIGTESYTVSPFDR